MEKEDLIYLETIKNHSIKIILLRIMTSWNQETSDFLKKIIEENESIGSINAILEKRTNIQEFFVSTKSIKDFIEFLSNELDDCRRKGPKTDLGDFQTPVSFSDQVCRLLAKDFKVNPEILVEPTCGQGNFVISAIKNFISLKHVICVEIQAKHEWLFKLRLVDLALKGFKLPVIQFFRENVFSFDFSRRLKKHLVNQDRSEILILGNPPWVTNSELMRLESINLPEKTNIKRFKGIEAITGKSNFDISEYIIISLIKNFSSIPAKLAILCKNTVAKNLIKDNPKLELPITKACIIEFDAREKFGINTPAAIFVAETYRGPTSGVNKQDRCKRFKFLGDKINFIGSFGWYANKFVSDISTYQPLEFIDGKSQLEWRQGLKHDLSKVLVLTRIKENTFMNGFGEQISIEEKHVYPFI
ncbi:MAG: hypothetical protein ACTSWN_00590, partial [Promethearchaeota archaeon]